MKLIAPHYYPSFRCIAGACRHTCCAGWEIDVDEDSLPFFLASPDIAPHIDTGDPPHISLLPGERCPFLRGDGLCQMILSHGEDSLCQICRDHPRFRNFFSDRTEVGVGLVCEEAARLILGCGEPMRLIVLEDDGREAPLPPQEAALLAQREILLSKAPTGPRGRLWEYLVFRHFTAALEDGRTEARRRLVSDFYREITHLWENTDGSLAHMAECVRLWSYDNEYDDEAVERRLSAIENHKAP